MSYFNAEGDLTDQDHADCLATFIEDCSKLPFYYSLSMMFVEENGNVLRRPASGASFGGFVNPHTQSDWCRFHDGWKACRRFSEK